MISVVTSATLVYLYGPPAVGKLTVARELQRQSGFKLFHNHLTVDAVRPVFDFASTPFMEVIHRLRLDVFETAANHGVNVISSASRHDLGKLVKPERLAQLLAQLDPSPLHPRDLVIDTGQLRPPDSAAQVMAHLKVESSSFEQEEPTTENDGRRTRLDLSVR